MPDPDTQHSEDSHDPLAEEQERVREANKETENDPEAVRTSTPPREPLRQRDPNVQGGVEDQEPIASLEVSEDSSTVTERHHNPGQARVNEEDDRSSAEFQAEREELDAKAAEGDDDVVEHYVPALIDTRSPETAYATKDNIVHPGPLGEALLAEKVAQELIPVDNVHVEIDPTIVPREEDETAREALDRARDEVELPDNPAPVSGPA